MSVVYLVEIKSQGAMLVSAKNPTQAVKHATKDLVTVKKLTSGEVAKAMAAGLPFEEVSAAEEDEAAPAAVEEGLPQAGPEPEVS